MLKLKCKLYFYALHIRSHTLFKKNSHSASLISFFSSLKICANIVLEHVGAPRYRNSSSIQSRLPALQWGRRKASYLFRKDPDKPVNVDSDHIINVLQKHQKWHVYHDVHTQNDSIEGVGSQVMISMHENLIHQIWPGHRRPLLWPESFHRHGQAQQDLSLLYPCYCWKFSRRTAVLFISELQCSILAKRCR